MTFDWTEFLKLARDLHERAEEADLPFVPEAAKRTAVSRAYYAAFCHARNYAEKRLGFQRSGSGQDHRSLRDFFRGQNIDVFEEVAARLDEARGWRNQCDYDDEVEELEAIVQNAMENAEFIIQQCR